MHTVLRTLIALLVAPSLALAQPSANTDESWGPYENARFGMKLVYPQDVFVPDHTKSTEAGQLFVSSDGAARLLIGAIENGEKHTPSSYQHYIAGESYQGFTFDYAPVGGTWTVLSGKKKGTMFYQKVIFTCSGRIINTFALTYPVAERQTYDPIVERIEDSFRGGKLCPAIDGTAR